MRPSRLKDKHRQNDMKRLKKKMQSEDSPTPTRIATAVNPASLEAGGGGGGNAIQVGNGGGGFFDD